jgi:protoporphyrinogen oxidase
MRRQTNTTNPDDTVAAKTVRQPSTIVLGGGVAGLAAARRLQQRGRSCILLERCPSIGGLTRTVNVSDFCFDYTGHFLHLSRFKTPADLPFAGLDNGDWQRIDRRSSCLVEGKMVTAPIQYNMWELPEDLRNACVASYDVRPPLSASDNMSLLDFIISGFGQQLADIFLIPQNEKTMSTSLDRLSMKAMGRFFPLPDEERVRAGIKRVSEKKEYNSTFWYPRVGGIELLVRGLANGIQDIRLNEEVIHIDLDRRTVYTRSGHTFPYDEVLSSIPLPDLCRISSDENIREQAQYLTHSTTICINLGLLGPCPPELNGLHWVYTPDKSIPFYRVGCYSNISAGTCSVGFHSLYVEVGVGGDRVDQVEIMEHIQPQVFGALSKLGWVDPASVVCVATHVIRCAYAHLTPEREELMPGIAGRLSDGGIRLIGRYGQWDYMSMEDCILSAISAVDHILP